MLLCHGFPELSWSWRHQIPALAAAGYRVIAPEYCGVLLRATQKGGHGRWRPIPICMPCGDMVALLDALGEKQAVIVRSTDWGSPIAWGAATLSPRPIPRRVASLSVMYNPRMRRCRHHDFAKANGIGETLYWLLFPAARPSRGGYGAAMTRGRDLPALDVRRVG